MGGGFPETSTNVKCQIQSPVACDSVKIHSLVTSCSILLYSIQSSVQLNPMHFMNAINGTLEYPSKYVPSFSLEIPRCGLRLSRPPNLGL